MNYLLDTNVLSELRKPEGRCAPAVAAWVGARHPSSLYLSVITVLEVEIGIRRLECRDLPQARRLRRWLEDDVLDAFSGRIVPVDIDVARRAATLHVPDPQPERDAYIAATAQVRGMTVATRNTADFASTGVALLNPWEA
ncbi:PIN domain-containing protein [Nocardiopsis coralliicola]